MKNNPDSINEVPNNPDNDEVTLRPEPMDKLPFKQMESNESESQKKSKKDDREAENNSWKDRGDASGPEMSDSVAAD